MLLQKLLLKETLSVGSHPTGYTMLGMTNNRQQQKKTAHKPNQILEPSSIGVPATGNLRSFDKSLWRENRRATAPNGQYPMSHFSSFNTAMTNWLIRCLSPIKANRR